MANDRPSAANATDVTGRWRSSGLARGSQPGMAQRRSVLSVEVVAIIRPSGLNATLETVFLCSMAGPTIRPVAISKSLTNRASPKPIAARYRPSGLSSIAAILPASSGKSSVRTKAPVSTEYQEGTPCPP